MLYVSNIVDENTIEVSDSRTSKATVVNTDKLRTEGTKVFGLTQSRVVAYRNVEDFLTRYALRQKLVNLDYAFTFEYADNEVRVSGVDIYANDGAVDLRIPDFVDTIADKAFLNNINIRSVYIPDSVVRLGRCCFCSCGILQSVRLSQSLTHLDDGVFYECFELKSVVLPEGITELGDSCFCWCEALTDIVLPESLTKLGKECFSRCKNLESIVLSKALTILGEDCFSSCESLKSLELPSSLQKIDEYVFKDCDSLEEIRIPSLLNIFENRTFHGCNNLHRLTIVKLSMLNETYLGTIGETVDLVFTGCSKLSVIRIENVADNSISDIETFIRHFKKGVPSIKIFEIDKSVVVSLNAISKELGIEIRPLEE